MRHDEIDIYLEIPKEYIPEEDSTTYGVSSVHANEGKENEWHATVLYFITKTPEAEKKLSEVIVRWVKLFMGRIT